MVNSRSHDSIVGEATLFTKNPRFKGYISDVGGPTANFRMPSCDAQKKRGMCKDRNCLAPNPCPNLIVSHSDFLTLLRRLRKIDGIKKVFIRSGIRFDYVMADKSDEFIESLCKHHVSGQLKVAPEHCSHRVLKLMGKPDFKVYRQFQKKFIAINKKLGKKQFLVPYLMSSHPGSTLSDAIELALFLKESGLNPQQVQDFYPTPGTVSTCMFHTGIDPMNGNKVYCAKNADEKAMQRALLQCKNPKNQALAKRALTEAGRSDLIGYGPLCLIKPSSGIPFKPSNARHPRKSSERILVKPSDSKHKRR